MAIRRARALRENSTAQLLHDLYEETGNLYNLRFRFATQQVGDVKEIRNSRKEIARMKTILRERELAGEDISDVAAEPPAEAQQPSENADAESTADAEAARE
ncbi:MAG: 50S ribosomal protein L29 [Armatimonadota bacterium]